MSRCQHSAKKSAGFASTTKLKLPCKFVSTQQGRRRQLALQALGRLGASKGKELWVGSKHVRAVSAEEAESMYMALCERTNEQHVLLIIYTPGCPQCKQMESEVEHLATGLSHINSLSVCALNIENDDVARYFAKEILGLKFVPSVVLFPKHSRTYYKFKGKAHSSEHLLRFLNMVCNQHDDKTWTLSNAATGVQSIGATQGGGISGIIQNRSDIALGLVGGAAVLLGVAGLAVRQRAVELQQQSDVTVAAMDKQDGGYRDLARSIDASITRMAILMLKLVGARIGLGVEHMRTSVPNYQLLLGGQQRAASTAAIDVPPSSSSPIGSQADPSGAPPHSQPSAPQATAPRSMPSSQPSTPNLGSRSRPASGSAASMSPWQTPRSTPSSSSSPTAGNSLVKASVGAYQGEEAPSSNSALVAAAAAARAAVAARSKNDASQQQGGGAEALVDAIRGQLPGQEDEASITGEAVKMARTLSADEVLRLLEEEGRDVGKVMERLSSQSQSQDKLFRVEKR